MPRAGGDFVFETRTISRVIGFAIPWASNLCFWLVFPTTGAFVANTLGLIPICTAFGWTAAADWLGTALGMTVVVLVILLLQWALAVFGVKFFRMAQSYVLIPFVVIGMVTMIVVLAVHWNADFTPAFDAYNAGTGITYELGAGGRRRERLRPDGLRPAQHAGLVRRPRRHHPVHHVRGAGHARRGEGGVQPAPALHGVPAAGHLHGIRRAVHPVGHDGARRRHEFLNQFATAYGSGAVGPAYTPNINIFVEMLAPSKWVVLLDLARLHRRRVRHQQRGVHERRPRDGGHEPRPAAAGVPLQDQPALLHAVSALTIWALVAVPIAIWFNYGDQDVAFAILTAVMISATTVIAFTVLGGTLFPYTAKGIYATAPVKRFTIGGVPLVTVLGVIGLIMIVPAIVWALVAPELGVTGTTARIALIVVYASGFVLYFIWDLVERRARRGRRLSSPRKSRRSDPAVRPSTEERSRQWDCFRSRRSGPPGCSSSPTCTRLRSPSASS